MQFNIITCSCYYLSLSVESIKLTITQYTYSMQHIYLLHIYTSKTATLSLDDCISHAFYSYTSMVAPWIKVQDCRKALKPEGAQRLNRVDLYGKNLIPMEKL